jgi:hypothetical protein
VLPRCIDGKWCCVRCRTYTPFDSCQALHDPRRKPRSGAPHAVAVDPHRSHHRDVSHFIEIRSASTGVRWCCGPLAGGPAPFPSLPPMQLQRESGSTPLHRSAPQPGHSGPPLSLPFHDLPLGRQSAVRGAVFRGVGGRADAFADPRARNVRRAGCIDRPAGNGERADRPGADRQSGPRATPRGSCGLISG